MYLCVYAFCMVNWGEGGVYHLSSYGAYSAEIDLELASEVH